MCEENEISGANQREHFLQKTIVVGLFDRQNHAHSNNWIVAMLMALRSVVFF